MTTPTPHDDNLKLITLFYIAGVSGEYYTTKLAAEIRARAAYPHESPEQREARVFHKQAYMEV